MTSTSRLIAINGNIPGGSGGVVRLDDTWVIVVNESADGRDWTGDGQQDREVVLAHNPASSGQRLERAARLRPRRVPSA